jgi:2-oxoglutarate ferredoxin oxidoreductase subunit alpha
MHDKRNKKIGALKKYMKSISTVNIYRGEHPSNIITYGSTTMSVIEALKYGQINPTIVQPVYLNPFPVWEFEEFKNQTNIVVEQSSTGQFADLLREKARINVKDVIKRYDGRPFDPIELSKKLKEVL